MSTQVVHGPRPTFTAQLSGGLFGIALDGYYTTTPGLGCGGVREVTWASDRPAKRLNELLVLRTVFVEWFLEQYRLHGGDRAKALAAIRDYPVERAWRE